MNSKTKTLQTLTRPNKHNNTLIKIHKQTKTNTQQTHKINKETPKHIINQKTNNGNIKLKHEHTDQ